MKKGTYKKNNDILLGIIAILLLILIIRSDIGTRQEALAFPPIGRPTPRLIPRPTPAPVRTPTTLPVIPRSVLSGIATPIISPNIRLNIPSALIVKAPIVLAHLKQFDLTRGYAYRLGEDLIGWQPDVNSTIMIEIRINTTKGNLEVIGLRDLGTQKNIPNEIVTKLENKFLNTLKRRFDSDLNAMVYQFFHNTIHTKAVIVHIDKIGDILGLTPRQKAIAKIIAAGHDLVQKFEVKNGILVRFRGPNESESANEVIVAMKQINREYGYDYFTEADFKVTREAIMATVPEFDPAKGTVVQPSLTSKSSLIAKAMSLADLYGTSLSPELRKTGNNLWLEEHPGLRVDQRKYGSLENIPKEKQAEYRESMQKWLESQAGFAEGRKNQLESDLEGLPENVKEAMREHFKGYDKAIADARAYAEKVKSMTFEELAREMGYRDIPR